MVKAGARSTAGSRTSGAACALAVRASVASRHAPASFTGASYAALREPAQYVIGETGGAGLAPRSAQLVRGAAATREEQHERDDGEREQQRVDDRSARDGDDEQHNG